jgi:hypothetical protein
MLIHRTCKQKVLLDLSECITFVSGFGYTSSGLFVNLVNMLKLKSRGSSKFICPQCKVTVPVAELDVLCCYCGEMHPASDAVIPKEAGGVFCSKCGENFFGDDVTKLSLSHYVISKDALNG